MISIDLGNIAHWLEEAASNGDAVDLDAHATARLLDGLASITRRLDALLATRDLDLTGTPAAAVRVAAILDRIAESAAGGTVRLGPLEALTVAYILAHDAAIISGAESTPVPHAARCPAAASARGGRPQMAPIPQMGTAPGGAA